MLLNLFYLSEISPINRNGVLTGIVIVILSVLILVFRKKVLRPVKWISNSDYAVNRRLKELLFELSVYGAIATDLDGRILMWNKRAAHKFGYIEQDMIGKNITVIFSPECRIEYEQMMDEFKHKGRSHMIGNDEGIVMSGLHRDGHEFPIHVKFIEINDDGFKSVAVFVRNITADKAREEKLRTEIYILNGGEIASKTGSWRWNLSGEKVDVSLNFCKLFNVDCKNEITSMELMELIYKPDRAETALVINEAVENKRNYTATYRRVQSDGSKHWIEVRGMLRFDDEGEVSEIYGSIQYIETADE